MGWGGGSGGENDPSNYKWWMQDYLIYNVLDCDINDPNVVEFLDVIDRSYYDSYKNRLTHENKLAVRNYQHIIENRSNFEKTIDNNLDTVIIDDTHIFNVYRRVEAYNIEIEYLDSISGTEWKNLENGFVCNDKMLIRYKHIIIKNFEGEHYIGKPEIIKHTNIKQDISLNFLKLPIFLPYFTDINRNNNNSYQKLDFSEKLDSSSYNDTYKILKKKIGLLLADKSDYYKNAMFSNETLYNYYEIIEPISDSDIGEINIVDISFKANTDNYLIKNSYVTYLNNQYNNWYTNNDNLWYENGLKNNITDLYLKQSKYDVSYGSFKVDYNGHYIYIPKFDAKSVSKSTSFMGSHNFELSKVRYLDTNFIPFKKDFFSDAKSGHNKKGSVDNNDNLEQKIFYLFVNDIKGSNTFVSPLDSSEWKSMPSSNEFKYILLLGEIWYKDSTNYNIYGAQNSASSGWLDKINDGFERYDTRSHVGSNQSYYYLIKNEDTQIRPNQIIDIIYKKSSDDTKTHTLKIRNTYKQLSSFEIGTEDPSGIIIDTPTYKNKFNSVNFSPYSNFIIERTISGNSILLKNIKHGVSVKIDSSDIIYNLEYTTEGDSNTKLYPPEDNSRNETLIKNTKIIDLSYNYNYNSINITNDIPLSFRPLYISNNSYFNLNSIHKNLYKVWYKINWADGVSGNSNHYDISGGIPASNGRWSVKNPLPATPQESFQYDHCNNKIIRFKISNNQYPTAAMIDVIKFTQNLGITGPYDINHERNNIIYGDSDNSINLTVNEQLYDDSTMTTSKTFDSFGEVKFTGLNNNNQNFEFTYDMTNNYVKNNTIKVNNSEVDSLYIKSINIIDENNVSTPYTVFDISSINLPGGRGTINLGTEIQDLGIYDSIKFNATCYIDYDSKKARFYNDNGAYVEISNNITPNDGSMNFIYDYGLNVFYGIHNQLFTISNEKLNFTDYESDDKYPLIDLSNVNIVEIYDADKSMILNNLSFKNFDINISESDNYGQPTDWIQLEKYNNNIKEDDWISISGFNGAFNISFKNKDILLDETGYHKLNDNKNSFQIKSFPSDNLFKDTLDGSDIIYINWGHNSGSFLNKIDSTNIILKSSFFDDYGEFYQNFYDDISNLQIVSDGTTIVTKNDKSLIEQLEDEINTFIIDNEFDIDISHEYINIIKPAFGSKSKYYETISNEPIVNKIEDFFGNRLSNDDLYNIKRSIAYNSLHGSDYDSSNNSFLHIDINNYFYDHIFYFEPIFDDVNSINIVSNYNNGTVGSIERKNVSVQSIGSRIFEHNIDIWDNSNNVFFGNANNGEKNYDSDQNWYVLYNSKRYYRISNDMNGTLEDQFGYYEPGDNNYYDLAYTDKSVNNWSWNEILYRPSYVDFKTNYKNDIYIMIKGYYFKNFAIDYSHEIKIPNLQGKGVLTTSVQKKYYWSIINDGTNPNDSDWAEVDDIHNSVPGTHIKIEDATNNSKYIYFQNKQHGSLIERIRLYDGEGTPITDAATLDSNLNTDHIIEIVGICKFRNRKNTPIFKDNRFGDIKPTSLITTANDFNMRYIPIRDYYRHGDFIGINNKLYQIEVRDPISNISGVLITNSDNSGSVYYDGTYTYGSLIPDISINDLYYSRYRIANIDIPLVEFSYDTSFIEFDISDIASFDGTESQNSSPYIDKNIDKNIEHIHHKYIKLYNSKGPPPQSLADTSFVFFNWDNSSNNYYNDMQSGTNNTFTNIDNSLNENFTLIQISGICVFTNYLKYTIYHSNYKEDIIDGTSPSYLDKRTINDDETFLKNWVRINYFDKFFIFNNYSVGWGEEELYTNIPNNAKFLKLLMDPDNQDTSYIIIQNFETNYNLNNYNGNTYFKDRFKFKYYDEELGMTPITELTDIKHKIINIEYNYAKSNIITYYNSTTDTKISDTSGKIDISFKNIYLHYWQELNQGDSFKPNSYIKIIEYNGGGNPDISNFNYFDNSFMIFKNEISFNDDYGTDALRNIIVYNNNIIFNEAEINDFMNRKKIITHINYTQNTNKLDICFNSVDSLLNIIYNKKTVTLPNTISNNDVNWPVSDSSFPDISINFDYIDDNYIPDALHCDNSLNIIIRHGDVSLIFKNDVSMNISDLDDEINYNPDFKFVIYNNLTAVTDPNDPKADNASFIYDCSNNLKNESNFSMKQIIHKNEDTSYGVLYPKIIEYKIGGVFTRIFEKDVYNNYIPISTNDADIGINSDWTLETGTTKDGPHTPVLTSTVFNNRTELLDFANPDYDSSFELKTSSPNTIRFHFDSAKFPSRPQSYVDTSYISVTGIDYNQKIKFSNLSYEEYLLIDPSLTQFFHSYSSSDVNNPLDLDSNDDNDYILKQYIRFVNNGKEIIFRNYDFNELQDWIFIDMSLNSGKKLIIEREGESGIRYLNISAPDRYVHFDNTYTNISETNSITFINKNYPNLYSNPFNNSDTYIYFAKNNGINIGDYIYFNKSYANYIYKYDSTNVIIEPNIPIIYLKDIGPQPSPPFYQNYTKFQADISNKIQNEQHIFQQIESVKFEMTDITDFVINNRLLSYDNEKRLIDDSNNINYTYINDLITNNKIYNNDYVFDYTKITDKFISGNYNDISNNYTFKSIRNNGIFEIKYDICSNMKDIQINTLYNTTNSIMPLYDSIKFDISYNDYKIFYSSLHDDISNVLGQGTYSLENDDYINIKIKYYPQNLINNHTLTTKLYNTFNNTDIVRTAIGRKFKFNKEKKHLHIGDKHINFTDQTNMVTHETKIFNNIESILNNELIFENNNILTVGSNDLKWVYRSVNFKQLTLDNTITKTVSNLDWKNNQYEIVIDNYTKKVNMFNNFTEYFDTHNINSFHNKNIIVNNNDNFGSLKIENTPSLDNYDNFKIIEKTINFPNTIKLNINKYNLEYFDDSKVFATSNSIREFINGDGYCNLTDNSLNNLIVQGGNIRFVDIPNYNNYLARQYMNLEINSDATYSIITDISSSNKHSHNIYSLTDSSSEIFGLISISPNTISFDKTYYEDTYDDIDYIKLKFVALYSNTGISTRNIYSSPSDISRNSEQINKIHIIASYYNKTDLSFSYFDGSFSAQESSTSTADINMDYYPTNLDDDNTNLIIYERPTTSGFNTNQLNFLNDYSVTTNIEDSLDDIGIVKYIIISKYNYINFINNVENGHIFSESINKNYNFEDNIKGPKYNINGKSRYLLDKMLGVENALSIPKKITDSWQVWHSDLPPYINSFASIPINRWGTFIDTADGMQTIQIKKWVCLYKDTYNYYFIENYSHTNYLGLRYLKYLNTPGYFNRSNKLKLTLLEKYSNNDGIENIINNPNLNNDIRLEYNDYNWNLYNRSTKINVTWKYRPGSRHTKYYPRADGIFDSYIDYFDNSSVRFNYNTLTINHKKREFINVSSSPISINTQSSTILDISYSDASNGIWTRLNSNSGIDVWDNNWIKIKITLDTSEQYFVFKNQIFVYEDIRLFKYDFDPSYYIIDKYSNFIANFTPYNDDYPSIEFDTLTADVNIFRYINSDYGFDNLYYKTVSTVFCSESPMDRYSIINITNNSGNKLFLQNNDCNWFTRGYYYNNVFYYSNIQNELDPDGNFSFDTSYIEVYRDTSSLKYTREVGSVKILENTSNITKVYNNLTSIKETNITINNMDITINPPNNPPRLIKKSIDTLAGTFVLSSNDASYSNVNYNKFNTNNNKLFQGTFDDNKFLEMRFMDVSNIDTSNHYFIIEDISFIPSYVEGIDIVPTTQEQILNITDVQVTLYNGVIFTNPDLYSGLNDSYTLTDTSLIKIDLNGTDYIIIQNNDCSWIKQKTSTGLDKNPQPTIQQLFDQSSNFMLDNFSMNGQNYGIYDRSYPPINYSKQFGGIVGHILDSTGYHYRLDTDSDNYVIFNTNFEGPIPKDQFNIAELGNNFDIRLSGDTVKVIIFEKQQLKLEDIYQSQIYRDNKPFLQFIGTESSNFSVPSFGDISFIDISYNSCDISIGQTNYKIINPILADISFINNLENSSFIHSTGNINNKGYFIYNSFSDYSNNITSESATLGDQNQIIYIPNLYAFYNRNRYLNIKRVDDTYYDIDEILYRFWDSDITISINNTYSLNNRMYRVDIPAIQISGQDDLTVDWLYNSYYSSYFENIVYQNDIIRDISLIPKKESIDNNIYKIESISDRVNICEVLNNNLSLDNSYNYVLINDVSCQINSSDIYSNSITYTNLETDTDIDISNIFTFNLSKLIDLTFSDISNYSKSPSHLMTSGLNIDTLKFVHDINTCDISEIMDISHINVYNYYTKAKLLNGEEKGLRLIYSSNPGTIYIKPKSHDFIQGINNILNYDISGVNNIDINYNGDQIKIYTQNISGNLINTDTLKFLHDMDGSLNPRSSFQSPFTVSGYSYIINDTDSTIYSDGTKSLDDLNTNDISYVKYNSKQLGIEFIKISDFISDGIACESTNRAPTIINNETLIKITDISNDQFIFENNDLSNIIFKDSDDNSLNIQPLLSTLICFDTSIGTYNIDISGYDISYNGTNYRFNNNKCSIIPLKFSFLNKLGEGYNRVYSRETGLYNHMDNIFQNTEQQINVGPSNHINDDNRIFFSIYDLYTNILDQIDNIIDLYKGNIIGTETINAQRLPNIVKNNTIADLKIEIASQENIFGGGNNGQFYDNSFIYAYDNSWDGISLTNNSVIKIRYSPTNTYYYFKNRKSEYKNMLYLDSQYLLNQGYKDFDISYDYQYIENVSINNININGEISGTLFNSYDSRFLYYTDLPVNNQKYKIYKPYNGYYNDNTDFIKLNIYDNRNTVTLFEKITNSMTITDVLDNYIVKILLDNVGWNKDDTSISIDKYMIKVITDTGTGTEYNYNINAGGTISVPSTNPSFNAQSEIIISYDNAELINFYNTPSDGFGIISTNYQITSVSSDSYSYSISNEQINRDGSTLVTWLGTKENPDSRYQYINL